MLQLKTPEQIDLMRAAGAIVGETLARLRDAVRPGISTAELDALAEASIRAAGAIPSFLGYSDPPYPASICASVNDEVVHGIPGPRVLEDGDLISIDCGAILAGWHGDAAITVPVGSITAEHAELLRVTEAALAAGIAAMQRGGVVRDVGTAIEAYVESQGTYGIVEGYTGHGIGTEMHQEPEVPNYRTRWKGPKLKPGLVLAIEPMITLGSAETRIADDAWTVLTEDGSWAAHFEHSVAITEGGPQILTALP